MKTETVAATFDDLIFENRNKEYGAYDIRKSYSANATRAMLICLLGAAGILMLSGFKFFSDKTIVVVEDNKGIIDVLPPPMIESINPPTQQHLPPPAREVVRDLPPLVTVEEVPDQPEELTQTATAVDGPTDPNGVEVNTTSTVGEYIESIPVEPENTIFLTAEVMPKYKDGLDEMMRFMQRKLRYPSRSQRLEIQGTVYVGFVVNREGKVVDVTIVKGISEDCDKEAARVISMMSDWIPGSQRGIPVSVRMVLPVTFRLNRS